MSKPVTILLVEDNLGDVELTREGLEEGKVLNELHVVHDGEAALAFLRREGVHAAAPRPDLILLDLNLPRMDGHEVLAAIKGEERLRSIPVVVLTTSKADEDILQSYDLHANCYISKPINFGSFIDVVKGIEQFWFTMVALPRQPSAP
jgi:two-component system, chemotaxis family, response regulator Rcp1